MKTISLGWLGFIIAGIIWSSTDCLAQVNSGSDGHDGAFNPTQNIVINMADHPDGIYQYTSVNIRTNVTVTFIPNGNNTPVIWLVQSNCIINGSVNVSGKSAVGGFGGAGGPGGYAGGSAGGTVSTAGQGPGGGKVGGGNASYGSLGQVNNKMPSGPIYGNSFLLPLLGGSGGGAAIGTFSSGGGGGGGAFLIAAGNRVDLNGTIYAIGGAWDGAGNVTGGGGSGGAVRIVATSIGGPGAIYTDGGQGYTQNISPYFAGVGRVRFDALNANIATISGAYSKGFQPIIIPGSGANAQLTITSVAGVNVGANPKGLITTPDIVIPARTDNNVAVVIQCSNIPLNTPITAIAVPTTGPAVQASGVNSSGTLTASSATISLKVPRGGGLIYAQAVTGVGGTSGASLNNTPKVKSYAETGLTTSGERFANMEITAAAGATQKITYVTQSGTRYVMPEN